MDTKYLLQRTHMRPNCPVMLKPLHCRPMKKQRDQRQLKQHNKTLKVKRLFFILVMLHVVFCWQCSPQQHRSAVSLSAFLELFNCYIIFEIYILFIILISLIIVLLGSRSLPCVGSDCPWYGWNVPLCFRQ